ncbi:MAG TPA: chemotaxis protein CheD [Ignavibacteriales bacterium]|nr:chemotaxis protein CheD [Ignavibacteriales bacterium]
MIPGRNNLPVIFLNAGEYHVSDKPEIVSTVLGSCISVILFSRQSPVCGITHSLLPACSYEASACKSCTEAYRYVDCSIIKLIQEMEQNKISIKDMEAKVFGGAGTINKGRKEKDNVGGLNVEAAFSTLEREGIKVTSRDTGGTRGRKLFLFTDSKEVFIKKLSGTENQR